MREGLRAKYGMGAFAVILKDEILEKLKNGNVVLDGLYSWSEYKILHELLGDRLIVLAVVTNSHIRKERLACREVRPLTSEQVDSRDIAEIENLEKADYYIINNGDCTDLCAQLQDFMGCVNTL